MLVEFNVNVTDSLSLGVFFSDEKVQHGSARIQHAFSTLPGRQLALKRQSGINTVLAQCQLSVRASDIQ